MTDHAAEAQRMLADLRRRIDWVSDNTSEDAYTVISDNRETVTATALLAIAHTLQAIHQTISENASPARCAAIYGTHKGGARCIRAISHTEAHETPGGIRWW